MKTICAFIVSYSLFIALVIGMLLGSSCKTVPVAPTRTPQVFPDIIAEQPKLCELRMEDLQALVDKEILEQEAKYTR